MFAAPLSQPRFGELVEGMMPPLGILYLAQYLRKVHPGLELRATDGLTAGFQATVDEIKRFRPDVLCISALTAAALGAYALAERAKAEIPGVVVIMGGPHASALPDDVLPRSKVDVVAVGEGEVTLAELVGLLLAKGRLSAEDLLSVPGVAFRLADGAIHRTYHRAHVVDLDTIPFPARDLLPLRGYRGYYLCKQTPEYTMMFSRGCPADCTFCANYHWNCAKPKVRWRSPKNVVDEMQELRSLGIREIQDVADEFNNSVRNAAAICEEMIRRKLGMTWKTCVRAHPLPEELVRLMAEAGCWAVSLGIESGNPETLEGVGKLVTLEQIESACRLLNKYDIHVQGLMMLFNVWEENGQLRYEDMAMTEKSLQFASKLVSARLVKYLGWSVATPYPGSELYDIALRHNLIKESLRGNWDAWIRDDPFVLRLPGISVRDMARMKRKGSILRALCMLRSGHFGLKDVGIMAKKGLKVLATEMGALAESRRSRPAAGA